MAAVAATATLAVVRTALAPDVPQERPEDFLPLLIAAGLLCLIGLARNDYPTAAWLATIGVASIVTIDLAAFAGGARTQIDEQLWPWLVIAVCLTALLATTSAAGYAIGRQRLPRRSTVALGGAAVTVLAVACVIAVATASAPAPDASGSPLGNARLVTRTIIIAVPLLTLVGLIGDALPAGERARRRVALGSLEALRTRRLTWLAAWLRALVDEIAPGRSRARRDVLAERRRIARDLHADVVPVLRQALRDAERDAPSDRLTASLRDALAQVEALGIGRHPIQLEFGGLVGALEWLAERTESDSRTPVTLNVADRPRAAFGSPPSDVSAAAFRVAALALDNVVRHAPGSRTEICVTADSDVVDLTISDDGPGISADAIRSATSQGRQGVADMLAEGAGCGADVGVESASNGSGTIVTFHWRSPSRPRR